MQKYRLSRTTVEAIKTLFFPKHFALEIMFSPVCFSALFSLFVLKLPLQAPREVQDETDGETRGCCKIGEYGSKQSA